MDAAIEALAVIGGGAMGSAMLGGLLTAEVVAPAAVTVAETHPGRAADVAEAMGVATTPSAAEAVAAADVVLLAVKPQVYADVCEQMAPALRDDALVVSIVAGVASAAIETQLPLRKGRRVVRMMPNTAALVGASVTAVAPGAFATEADLEVAERIASSVGVCVRADESQLDIVTGVSGSGPAYVFLVAEALTDGAVAMGLSRDVATILVHQTLAGAAALLIETGRSPADLRAQVTSPAGTTAAGLGVLERRAVRSAFVDAVSAATERSVELGRPPA
ncbi:MAG: pyrroline-5-carboxylate reductase [Acidimicrobiia bacterium]|nr:pyrroline-5-carboxylate reductase [Acidimicrobiia bacterium]